jgi:type II secretory pathway pseudopilin PulG
MSPRPTPRTDRHETGMALITVLVALTVLLALAVTVVTYASSSRTTSRRDQNWNAALNAAEAGVDDYLFHLNENSDYTAYSASNPPPDGNLAFARYVPVPGGTSDSEYRYSVDASALTTEGTVTVTSTGRVKTSERTIQSILRRRNFLDYLYFTDYETKDPAAYTGSPFSPTEAQSACAKHYNEGRDSRCTTIVFVSQDTIAGPLHTNDTLRMCGNPTFNGKTSTSWQPASGRRWLDECPTSRPRFANGGDPSYLPPLALPPSNSALKAQTSSVAGGCLYTGPTRIRLLASGQMNVKSPFSVDTRNGCPTNGNGPLPRNGVIYVQGVPSNPTDVNSTPGCPYRVNGRAHPLGLPINNDITTYGCRNGDAFVDGTLADRLTIATENNITVVGDTTYKDGTSGRDLLGLVANNFVETWHPVRCSSGTGKSCNLDANFPGEASRGEPLDDLEIQAAILAVNHSFRVQNYNIGAPLGTLTVEGAIAQRYRGLVGTNSGGTVQTGYAKDYRYDRRLKYLTPPKFLDPVASAWGIAVWKEIQNP